MIIVGTKGVLAFVAGAILPITPAKAAFVAPTPPTPVAAVAEADGHWDRLADCESRGEWDYGPHSDWGSGIYEGGLQFLPATWDEFRDPDMPAAAYHASREQQIEVANRVQAAQGWQAWPVCSRKVGLR